MFRIIAAAIALLIATPTAFACTNVEGIKIASVLEIPELESTPEEIDSTLTSMLQNAETVLNQTLAIDLSTVTAFEESPIAVMDKGFRDAFAPGRGLNLITNVFEDEAMRNTAVEALQAIGTWSNENVSLNVALYKLLVDFRDNTDVGRNLTGERRRLLDNEILAMELQGIGLQAEERGMVQAMSTRMTEVATELQQNIASIPGTVNFTMEELDGLSSEQLDQLDFNNETNIYSVDTRVRAQSSIVLDFATNRETRERVQIAENTRVRDANAEGIHELVALRQKTAEILGYETWADARTATRMAGDRETAYSFTENLSDRLYPLYLDEMQELIDLHNELEGTDSYTLENFQAADRSYLYSIYTEQETGIDPEEAREYFEEKATIRALFDIYEDLFGIVITIEEGVENGWTEDLQLVNISDASDGSVIAAVYLDLHPRDGKFTHFAFTSLVQGHVRDDGNYQAPVGLIFGNWPTPTEDRPSLWSLDNVRTMFHEFGHAIHASLTCTEFAALSGTSVARDFVEAPSQMLEYWLEDPNVLTSISRHFENGEPMSRDMAMSLISAGSLFPATFEVRQAALSLADFEIHSYASADQIPSTGYEIYNVTNYFYYEHSNLVPAAQELAAIAGFGHLWGGYDAGYYGYAWSRVIAADMAKVFREAPNGFYDKEVGARYRKEILERGNSADPNDLIRNFLGRDFNSNAFFEAIVTEELEQQQENPTATDNGYEDDMDPLNTDPCIERDVNCGENVEDENRVEATGNVEQDDMASCAFQSIAGPVFVLPAIVLALF